MTEIQKQTLERALVLLNALGVDYKIITKDGKEYGDLKVMQRQHKKTYSRKVSHGAYMDVIKPKLERMLVGDVTQFSNAFISNIPGASVEGFRGALSAHAGQAWGNGNYTTTITNTHVEIMRLV